MKGLTIERIAVHRDGRGVLFDPIGAEALASGALRNVHVATMAPGAVRGGHRHLGATEQFCFCGEIAFIAQDPLGNREKFEFTPDECVRITIAPGIAHAAVNTGTKETFFVCFSDKAAGTDPQEKVALV